MNFIEKILLKFEISQTRLRVKLKTTIFASVAAAIFLISLFAIVYFIGFNMFRNRGVESQSEIARILASAVDEAINNEVELLRLNANSQFIIDNLKVENLKYRAKSEKDIQLYLVEMDKKWKEASGDDLFLKDYLGNKLSQRLSGLVNESKKIITVTIADRFGGLAGSTTREKRFYSFDRNWWLSSFAKGHGNFYIGDVEFDQANNLWCLPLAVPIEDELGAVIGAYRALISLDTFFKPLLNFKIGNTGRVSLVDDKAFLIYHKEALPFVYKYCEYAELQKTLQNSEKWGVLNSAYLNHGSSLVAYSEISHPSLMAKKIKWFVFVERNLGEIFAPLDKFIIVAILIGLGLIIMLALIVFIFSGRESLKYSMFQVDENSPAAKIENSNNYSIEKMNEGLHKDK